MLETSKSDHCFKGGFKMDVQSVVKFKKILTAERERLLNVSKESIKHDLNISTDDLPDEADLAASEITQSLTFELRNRERIMIAKIDTALASVAWKRAPSLLFALPAKSSMNIAKKYTRNQVIDWSGKTKCLAPVSISFKTSKLFYNRIVETELTK
jgi:hypothetical protein